MVEFDFPFSEAGRVQVAAFAHEPHDARSACIGVVKATPADPEGVASTRPLCAPVVFLHRGSEIEVWRQGAGPSQRVEQFDAREIDRFVDEHRAQLAPEAIYRAKTRGRFDASYQLSFVDVGLMPAIERELGQQLGRTVEQLVGILEDKTGERHDDPAAGHTFFQTAFWLVAAKALRDKRVSSFHDLDLADVEEVFRRVGRHYGATPLTIATKKLRAALGYAAAFVARSPHLGQVTTEALAHVYENTFVSETTRATLGTHSTPSYLVDYIVSKLAPWIEQIPVDDRHVLEPACGHAAFLVAAMRLLRDLHPGSDPPAAYLRGRLHGFEIDGFAREIARLSLTLADIPRPDGWDLRSGDMFDGDALSTAARSATILLANPPFERLPRAHPARIGGASPHNKAAAVLSRTIPFLPPGAVVGVVLPRSVLDSKDGASVRANLMGRFDVLDVLLLPDTVFHHADAESAVLLARRPYPRQARATSIQYRRVREGDVSAFSERGDTSAQWSVAAESVVDPHFSLGGQDLHDLWVYLDHLAPLSSLATVGKGVDFLGESKRPKGVLVRSPTPFPGAAPGFCNVSPALQLHGLPPIEWLNLDRRAISRYRAGRGGAPQVLLNYHPVDRGPWMIKAVIDREGHPFTSSFLCATPHDMTRTPLEFLWALCNSTIANAWAYTDGTKRDITVGVMGRLPTPGFDARAVYEITEAVRAYFIATREVSPADADASRQRAILMHIEGLVLSLYALPQEIECSLLELFKGEVRGGVPFGRFDLPYHAEAPGVPPRCAMLTSTPLRLRTTERAVAAPYKTSDEPPTGAIASARDALIQRYHALAAREFLPDFSADDRRALDAVERELDDEDPSSPEAIAHGEKLARLRASVSSLDQVIAELRALRK